MVALARSSQPDKNCANYVNYANYAYYSFYVFYGGALVVWPGETRTVMV